jgi:riboflavin synthase
MFTGIIQAVGEVREASPQREELRLRIAAGKLDLTTANPGDSIAVSGVCLTVVALHGDGFSADVSAETLRCTTFAALRAGDRVNLEQALTLAAPLGGHLVSGHVDGIAAVRARTEEGQSVRYRIEVPRPLSKYIAAKGSVCIDGVSLTVNAVEGEDFEVNIVPHTLRETTLGACAVGKRVNLEVDLMARYIERLLLSERGIQGGRLTRELLAEYGFIDE